jgi:hypothetical protein
MNDITASNACLLPILANASNASGRGKALTMSGTVKGALIIPRVLTMPLTARSGPSCDVMTSPKI